MDTSVETLEGNKVRLKVAVPADEFEKAMDAAFRKLAREVRIPGFRPGKAPRRILEARIGTELAREEALKSALPQYYMDAVTAEKVDVIAQPEIEITAGQEDGDVEFDAVVEVRPTPEINGYKGLQVTVPSPEVPDEDVEAQITGFRDRFAELEESTTPLAEGDYVQVNIKGYQHDEEVPGLTASDFLYAVGSDLVSPKMDKELQGRRPGDIVKFNDTLPARWGEMAGQEVSFQILIKETKRKVLPELTDEWVKEATEFETIGALQADIRGRMSQMRRLQTELALRDKLMDEVANLVDIEVPPALVREELERRLHNVLHRLEEQGATVEQFLASTGQTQQEFVDTVEAESTVAVKADLALRSIVAQEAIEVTDEEVDDEVARLAERTGKKPAAIRKEIERGRGLEAVRSELSRGKALQILVEHALAYDEAGNKLDLTQEEDEEAPADAEPKEESEA
jgi:trigger factor